MPPRTDRIPKPGDDSAGQDHVDVRKLLLDAALEPPGATNTEAPRKFLQDLLGADLAVFDNYRQVWLKLHPTEEFPTLAQLAAFLWHGECPDEDLTEANSRLNLALGLDTDDQPAQWMPRHMGPDGSDGTLYADCPGIHIRLTEILKLVDAARSRDPSILHPLPPLIRAWQTKCPYQVTPSARTTRRIIPGKLAQAHLEDHRTVKGIFLPAAYSPDGQQVLPGFGMERRIPAPPLAIYEMGGGHHEGGRAAPLPQRMFIESLFAVPQEERGTGRPVAYEVTLRDFLSWFWPDRQPSPSEYWDKLERAVRDLDDLRIPIIDPDTGNGHLRRIVNITGIPRGPQRLDDTLRVVVDLPHGSQNGPQVSDRLRYWGNRSAPAWRGLINLAYIWHSPGLTHYPVPRRGRKGGHVWLRSQDPHDYPEMSDQDLIDICFPTSINRSNQRVLLQRVRRTLRLLEQEGELRIQDRRILPPTPDKGM